MTDYFIGTSGWHYDHWKSVFYPQGLPKGRWLEHYALHLSTVEVNNSFYRLPTENAFRQWRQAVPDRFVFALKVSRLITHLRKLRNVDEALKVFLERASILGNRLGPLLYQLPPFLHRDDTLLTEFLRVLPPGSRHTVEFRHESWLVPEIFDILAKYNVAVCLYHMPQTATPVIATADFAYMRFHGTGQLYGGSYSDEDLGRWANDLRKLAAAHNLNAVYVYFNNDAFGYAVKNAMTLKHILA